MKEKTFVIDGNLQSFAITQNLYKPLFKICLKKVFDHSTITRICTGTFSTIEKRARHDSWLEFDAYVFRSFIYTCNREKKMDDTTKTKVLQELSQKFIVDEDIRTVLSVTMLPLNSLITGLEKLNELNKSCTENIIASSLLFEIAHRLYTLNKDLLESYDGVINCPGFSIEKGKLILV